MSQVLWNLVYTSSSINWLSENELVDLLEVSRTNNRANNITGMLLYCDKLFIQALEGPREDVHATFAKISKDPRHRSIHTLIDQPIEQRNFPEWTMGFHSIKMEKLQQIPDFETVIDQEGTWLNKKIPQNHAMHLLLAFKKSFCD